VHNVLTSIATAMTWQRDAALTERVDQVVSSKTFAVPHAITWRRPNQPNARMRVTIASTSMATVTNSQATVALTRRLVEEN